MRTRSTKRALATTISRPPQRIEIVEIRDITRHCGDAFADLGLRPIKCALASSHDKDIGACLCRSLRSRQPNSARAFSDNGDFALLGSTSHVFLRRTTATLVMRRLDIPIATGLDLILQRSVGRCYFDKWLWRSVNWRKNWPRVAKQHKHARRTRIRKKMPDIGQLLPVDLGRKTRLCGLFLKVSLGAVNRNALRDRCVTNSRID